MCRTNTVGNRKFKFSNLSLENHQILMVLKLYLKPINQFFIFCSNSKEILDFFSPLSRILFILYSVD